MRKHLCLLFSFVAMGGCSEASSSPESSSPAEPSAPSLVTEPVEPALGPSCHSTENSAPLVEEEEVVGARPDFAGGTIEPGLYHRTRTIRFVGENDTQPHETKKREKQTLRIAADGSVEVVHANEGGPDDPTSFVITTSGTELRFTLTCPEIDEPHSLSFTATANELTIANGTDGLIVYRRQ